MITTISKKEYLQIYTLVGLAQEVHANLGRGLEEAIYQEAFEIALKKETIPYEREKSLRIKFLGQWLKKEYVADFVCFDKIIVEMKAVSSLTSSHEDQVMNYLKATGCRLGLLFNFGADSFQYRRLVK